MTPTDDADEAAPETDPGDADPSGTDPSGTDVASSEDLNFRSRVRMHLHKLLDALFFLGARVTQLIANLNRARVNSNKS